MQWSHNEHYHSCLLRQVPSGAKRALDVGCGTGGFARELAKRVEHVDAIDSSEAAVQIARERSAAESNISFALVNFLDHEIAAPYDLVSCIAALHHMPVQESLRKLRDAVAPGGVLVVLGLWRLRPREYPLYAISTPLNVSVGAAKWAARGFRSHPHAVMEAPVRDPAETFDQIRAHAERVVPGASLRRHLFWRYSLIWRYSRG